MSYAERKKQILELLASRDACSVHWLSQQLYVSGSTLRRDLIALAEEGIIERHHGGITLAGGSSSEDSVYRRKMINQEQKARIAQLAVSYIRDGMVIFLDSSSTVNQLCLLLRRFRSLTVVTNDIFAAQSLSSAANIRCYVCPGLLKPQSNSIVGEYAAEFLDNFRADAFFFSCKALSRRGIFEGDDAQAMIKRSMLQHADRSILLCDSSKEQALGYFRLAGFSSLERLITDAPLSDALTEAVQTAGCVIELAG